MYIIIMPESQVVQVKHLSQHLYNFFFKFSFCIRIQFPVLFNIFLLPIKVFYKNLLSFTTTSVLTICFNHWPQQHFNHLELWTVFSMAMICCWWWRRFPHSLFMLGGKKQNHKFCTHPAYQSHTNDISDNTNTER